MVCVALTAYWSELQSKSAIDWPLRELPNGTDCAALPETAQELASAIGTCAAGMDVTDAGYAIGLLYTGALPERLRAKLGAYYTPPALCERLLDMAADAGVDWQTARVLDPACGGGAFLAPVARRMVEHLPDVSASNALGEIARRLRGFEIDPFAAWMSQVFVDAALGDLCGAAGARLPPLVSVCNSLEQTPDGGGFDLVVGNPPYGRTVLSPALRAAYRRSLFGHANRYGLFTDLALRFARPGGVVAYVTPCRLADYGYRVSTGPLVWNRHKGNLRDRPGKGRYPLLWAESVRPDGVFRFRAQKRNHQPYFQPDKDEFWVVTDHPCVLLQRTTAKEQGRRLIAAELPASFIDKHQAVVVENHLNMIRPIDGAPRVSPAAVAALLNSAVVDQLFRCINGSVAVSAYELEALPLPAPEEMQEIERLVHQSSAEHQILEHAVAHLYGNGA